MTKKEALKIWDFEMGNKEYAYDFAFRKIKRSEYGEDNSVGWVIGNLKPLSLGGKDDDGNRCIMHHNTFSDKGDNYPDFTVLEKKYKVCYDEKNDYYYIEKETNFDIDEGGLV